MSRIASCPEKEENPDWKREADLAGGFEFSEEAEVVFAEEAEVFYLVFQVGDPLNSHTEGVTGVDLGVDTTCFQHVGVHHTTSENLNPSGSLAERAAFATADVA